MDLKARFPPEERLKFVRERFRAGAVVRLFCDFTTPHKFKWLLFVSLQLRRPLFFIINTDPTEFAKRNARLRDQQVPINKATNPFLKHDSFIDCSNAYDNFEKQAVIDALVNDTTLLLGTICSATASAVIESVSESETLSTIHINQISMEISRLVH